MKNCSPFFRTGTLLLLSACLGACSPEHLLIDQANLNTLESRLEQLDQQILTLAERQPTREELTLVQESVVQQLSEEIRSRVEPPVCPPQPKLSCPAVPAPKQPVVDAHSGKQVVGAVEDVLLAPPGIKLPARIDTGATTASLHASSVQKFERNGVDWVRFEMPHPETKENLSIEAKVVRYARIIQSTTEEGERRPVIELHFTLGNVSQMAEFTLTDRGHLDYPLLIGRNILKDLMIVDVAQTRIAPPKTTP